MTKDQMVDKFIDMNSKTVHFMEKVSGVLVQLNDQNKLHKQAIDTNTIATKEMTKSFNRIWNILWIIILALIILAGAEKVLKFI